MFELLAKDVHLNQQAQDKTTAIKHIAQALIDAGLVQDGYGEGMLQREQQAATYLDNGIAIPHGTTTTRDLVKKTGVQVFHFPQGVAWGDEGQLAYVAIGIAASSDEHLTLLRQLTHVLGEDDVEEKLKNIKTADDVVAILTGKAPASNELILDASAMLLDIAADSLSTLQALNASRLKKLAAVDSQYISHVIDTLPTYLGDGVWLSDSAKGNLKNALAISRPNSPLTEQDKPVKVLISAAAVSDAINPAIERLAKALFEKNVGTLMSGDAQSLIQFFDENAAMPSSTATPDNAAAHAEGEASQEFVVQNAHGLHTRPSSVLVKLVKTFESSVTVANVSGANKAVNAASLMKLVGLGAKKGDRLQFTATGPDAEQALAAIGQAMAEGLGEGVE